MLKKVYGENYNIREVIEKLLEPIGTAEREAYDKLLSDMSDEQKQLLDRYLRLYCEWIFKMQTKRFDAGFKAGIVLTTHKDW